MKTYNGTPREVGVFEIKPHYGINVLYMPVKMAGKEGISLPDSLHFLRDLIWEALIEGGYSILDYVYISYECSYVRSGVPQKRPGIHSDGFMTEDVNYIWTDKDPTIFYRTKFKVQQDHKISMEQFHAQVNPEDAYSFPVKTLLRLDESVVHDVSVPTESGVRQFFKLSISKHKYNLKGNTHNPCFDYDWKMYDRSIVRNHPIYQETDSVPEGVNL